SPNAPKKPLPSIPLSREDFAEPDAYAYYWLGHASAILELNHQRILIDPVFGNASPIPFTVPRYQPAPLAVKQLPPIDVVLITHDHYDHLEADAIRYLANNAAHFITPLGVGARLQSWGVAAEKITELGWTETVVRNGVTYTAERSNHYSSRWFNDRNKTLWAAYILEGAGKRLFWSCDGGYDERFTEFGKKYNGFDVAFVEIDAGNAGWPYTHMFPEQAVQAVYDLQAKLFVPIHWGVFDLGVHPWDESIKKVVTLSNEKKIPLVAPKLGEKYLFDRTDMPHWWE
ncbi:MAG TPA: multidrug transporter, partial [Pasteurellaceae bacterium]|nr:multidrug transporter [Pasteurellaceae bacterium]